MRGGWRFTIAVWTAGLLLIPAAASGQESPAPGNTSGGDAVGPPQLQNFSLPGTVVRPAEEAPQTPRSAPKSTVRDEPSARETAAVRQTTQRARAPTSQPAAPARAESRSTVETAAASSPASSPPEVVTSPPPIRASAPAFPPAAEGPTDTIAAEHGFSPVPWLLAILAAVAGAAFLFWRSRTRGALAGGPQADLFTAPEPEPAPAPPPRAAPAPPPAVRAEPPAAAPKSIGVVSTGLRPWIEVGVQPLRCIVADERVTIEFELQLFNSGSAPARDLLVEAVVINAGAEQDRERAEFFARANGEGERIDVLPPLQRLAFTTQVATAREHVRPIEMAGRQVFVPLLALNASYRWGSKSGRTSVSYLLGRDTKAEKLAPFRLDLGPRLFRGLGARLLPSGVRG